MNKSQEAYDWIMKILSTCNNDFHFDSIDALIELHFKNYQDKNLYENLKYSRTEKWNEIHFILA